jgi:DNA/RNA endonuclease G (NUC1)
MSYDKGHMAPSNNYCGSQELLDSTFTYANCVPQNSYFNRGSWKNL